MRPHFSVLNYLLTTAVQTSSYGINNIKNHKYFMANNIRKGQNQCVYESSNRWHVSQSPWDYNRESSAKVINSSIMKKYVNHVHL